MLNLSEDTQLVSPVSTSQQQFSRNIGFWVRPDNAYQTWPNAPVMQRPFEHGWNPETFQMYTNAVGAAGGLANAIGQWYMGKKNLDAENKTATMNAQMMAKAYNDNLANRLAWQRWAAAGGRGAANGQTHRANAQASDEYRARQADEKIKFG